MPEFIRKFFSARAMVKEEDISGDIPPSKKIYLGAAAIAWPSALESVLVSLIGSVDTIMVGGIGAAAIAAVGLTNQPKFISIALIFSLNVGVTVIVARRKGQKNQEGANQCLQQSILLSALLSTVISALMFVFGRPILEFAGAQPDVINDSTAYLQIIMCGMPFQAVGLTINAAQRGVGNTRISLRTNLMANLVNVLFNFLLINGIWFFPRLEVRGAAIATVIGNVTAFFMSLRSITNPHGFLQISLKNRWWFDKHTLLSIFNVSSSSLVEQLCMRVGFFFYAKIVAELGTLAFATHQICMNIVNISFSFGDGLGIAASSLVGQNLGAKRPDLATIYGKSLQRLALCISSVLFVIFVVFRRYFIMIFTREADIIALGAIIVVIIAFTTHLQTTQVVISGCLRGAGDTKFVALSSLISIGIVRPLGSWLLCYPLGMGLIGAWIGFFLDQLLRVILNYLRFNTGKWTKIEV